MSEFDRRPVPPPRRRRRRRRRRPNYNPLILFLAAVLVVMGLIALMVKLSQKDPEPPDTPSASTSTTKPGETTEPTTEPVTEPSVPPTEPPVTLVSTATIANMGDMLMHMPCIRPALDSNSGEYNFEHYFTYLEPYIAGADYGVANLETTLCSEEFGYKYYGYPDFNCPDGIVPSLQNVGFDMLLTANNHCYDTHSVGFHRTQEVMEKYGMDYTGTFADLEQPRYLIRDLNGIRIGMVCYTYEDNPDPNAVGPNDRTMTDEDEKLINSFNVKELDTFYTNIEAQIADMKANGAETIVLYIHWGAEYQLKENTTQQTIAQKMCDLGVDVIVGGHPHVVQPMDLLTSTQDAEHKTLCIYSTGNALSNQRRHLMSLNTGHTEDGVVFTFSVSKYSDGTVRVESVELIPTWINLYTSSETDKAVYDILPLDKKTEDWKTAMNLTDATLKEAEASYERTMAIVGEGLSEIEAYLESLPEVEGT